MALKLLFTPDLDPDVIQVGMIFGPYSSQYAHSSPCIRILYTYTIYTVYTKYTHTVDVHYIRILYKNTICAYCIQTLYAPTVGIHYIRILYVYARTPSTE